MQLQKHIKLSMSGSWCDPLFPVWPSGKMSLTPPCPKGTLEDCRWYVRLAKFLSPFLKFVAFLKVLSFVLTFLPFFLTLFCLFFKVLFLFAAYLNFVAPVLPSLFLFSLLLFFYYDIFLPYFLLSTVFFKVL